MRPRMGARTIRFVATTVAEALRAGAADALAATPVIFAYLFGSHATGRSGPHSDVDVACYVDPPPSGRQALDLRLDLAGRLERACGVGGVEVVLLPDVPLALAGRILRERVVVHSRDEPRRVRYESLTFRMFCDFDVHARRLDEQLLRATAEGRR